MYISLYRKYRPQTFSDMVGQSAAVSVLQESLKEGRLGHAYLFSGPRGCGKTSAARLVAKSLNCQNPSSGCEPCGECSSCVGISLGDHLDVIEIDGASNRGIGEIRDLKTHVNLKPLSAPYKVYIIDEVHMLTEAAFNALLKTLEEPPANVIFLLATTEPHKVPVTIRSRCQHIPFHRISIADMVSRISYVCGCENIESEKEAVWEIARQADGALRDALSLTEQAVALGRGSLTLESVRDLTGGSNRSELEKWITNLRINPEEAVCSLHMMLSRGMSPERFCESLFALFRDLWIFALWKEKGLEALEISEAERVYLQSESAFWDKDKLRRICSFCSSLLPRSRYGMRIEVFSGLIMIEIMKIMGSEEVALPTERQPQEEFNPHLRRNVPDVPVKESEPETERTKSDFDEMRFSSVSLPVSEDVSCDVSSEETSKICSELGCRDFSNLFANIKSRRLLIASALLNASLTADESGWDVKFECECPANVLLSVPQYRKILGDAVASTWHVTSGNDVSRQEESAAIPEMPHVGKQSAPEDKKNDDITPAGNSQPEAFRMLKLMGADILYIKEAGIAGEELSENGEH